MDNSTKKLLNGTAIYFVGNALANLMSLVLLRFITGRITTEEYGLYNLIVTISNLVTPFVTLQMTDAVFKFLLKSESNDEKKDVFSITIAVFSVSSVITVTGVLLINAFFVPIPHTVLVCMFLIANNFYALYHRVIRAMGRNKVYVVGNLLRTFLYLSFQMVLIYIFDLGIEALFLATVFSDIIFIGFAEIQIHSFRLFSFKNIKASVFKPMLRFSAPLIPNSAFWWLTSSVNTLIVSSRCGLDINGIYTVANKFSGVMSMVTSVFIMSWQEMAVSEYGKPEFKKFFTKTFNMYIKIVISVVGVIIPFMKAVYPIMIDESYYASIQYAPFLVIVSGLSTLSGFASQVFVGQGKTYRNLWTTAVGMVFNIAIVLIFVDSIGLWAAVFGSLVADAVMLLTRLFLVRKEFEGSVQLIKIIIALSMLTASVVFYINFDTFTNIIWLTLSLLVALFMNIELVKDTLTVVKSNIKSKADR